MAEKILITGADGFLGSHIVRRALKHGYEIRAFVQPGRNTGSINNLPIETFNGDITKEDDVRQALIGCDFLIHAAASTSVWPSRSQKVWEINYHSVVKLAELVKHSTIKRYVHIGSASSFGFGTKEKPGDESSPYSGAKFTLDYLDSKKEAQDYLLEQYRKSGLPVVIVAPTFLVGEYDSVPSSGKMILAVINHSIPGYSSGGRCFVYAGDVAEAAVKALQKGKLGESYIAGGENLSYKEYFDLISEISHTTPIRRKIPAKLSVAFGTLLETISNVTQKEPLLTNGMTRIANEGYYFSSKKAVNELDMPQTDIKEALVFAIDYFRSRGLLQ